MTQPSHPPGPRRRPAKRSRQREALGLRAFARAMGVRLRAVQEAIERGVLARSLVVRDGKRLIDAELGAQEWRENANPIRRANGEKLRKGSRAQQAAIDAAALEAAEVEQLTMQQAATKRMRWAAERERLTVAKMKGELVAVVEVERRAFACARAVRQALLAIPERLSGIVSTLEDPAEIARLLQGELVAALEEIGAGLAAATVEELEAEVEGDAAATG